MRESGLEREMPGVHQEYIRAMMQKGANEA